MKIKMIAPVALLVLAASVSAAAAVRYDFRQTTRSDVRDIPSMEVQGKAIVDGERSRVDFQGKSIYGENASVISLAGGRKLIVLNKDENSFTEINIESAAAALGASGIEVTNLKTDHKKLPDHPVIAGYPTDHYRVETSYDIRVLLGTLPLKQTVHTVTEKWTTSAFGEIEGYFALDGGLRTGNPQLDEIIELESKNIKGFPLRHMVRVTTTAGGAKKVAKGSSQISVAPHRTQISEMIVTSIELTAPTGDPFAVPAGYKRVEPTPQNPAAVNLTFTGQ